MENYSPEIRALITTIVYLECRVEAIMQILCENGVALNPEEVHTTMHKIHSVQGDVLKRNIACRIKDPKFDLG